MTTPEQVTAVGVFPDRAHAEYAVEQLCARGFRPEEIGVVTPDGGRVEVPPLDPGNRAEAGAGIGAAAGGAFGGLLGAALASTVVPGIGPVIAGGLLAGAVGGAAAGATGGGILGALVGMTVPEEQARRHESAFHSGRTLVVVRSPGRCEEAEAILRAAGQAEPRRHPGRPDLSRLEGSDAPAPGTGTAAVPPP